MNKRIAIRKTKNYEADGSGTITILMTIATVAVILFSVFCSI